MTMRSWLAFLMLSCAIALGACAPLRPQADAPLVLVSIDGYRADYLDRGLSPTLAALAADGVRAKALRPSFPTLTYPNHYTLLTGLYPDHHGIVDNAMSDPVLGAFSPGNREATADGRWWNGAEPLWATAEKHGVHTASLFWPGTAAEVHGQRPSEWRAIDPKVAPDARVDQVLAWLDEPPAQRPRFVMLYFEQVDSAAHAKGPDSPQVDAALRAVDGALAHLVDGLRQRGRYDDTNLIVLSDHGMAATSADRIVYLDDVLAPGDATIVSSLVLSGIAANAGREDAVAHALLTPHEHMQCWRKGEMPARLHYGRNARIPPFVCLASPGWMISTHDAEAHRGHAYLGEHGYAAADDPAMNAIFVAHGPAFARGRVVAAFDNVDVYALLARLIGVRPLANDGRERTAAALVAH